MGYTACASDKHLMGDIQIAQRPLMYIFISVRFSVRCEELFDKTFLCPSYFCLLLKYTYLDINSV